MIIEDGINRRVGLFPLISYEKRVGFIQGMCLALLCPKFIA